MSLERKIYPNPKTRLIAVSSLVAKQLKVHFERADVAVIPNSTDTQRFNIAGRKARREESRQHFGFSDDDFVLLFIGNDWKKKGLDSLLRACALLRDLHLCLLVVGADDQNVYLPLFQQLALRCPVRFERPTADVLSFYASADVYISPALEDAFGLPILEAMACGLPVIASIHAGASDNINEGETGLLLQDPRDPAEIARQIRLLCVDRAFGQKMGLAAAQYAQANCSLDQNASTTREFLESTVHDQRAE